MRDLHQANAPYPHNKVNFVEADGGRGAYEEDGALLGAGKEAALSTFLHTYIPPSLRQSVTQ